MNKWERNRNPTDLPEEEKERACLLACWSDVVVVVLRPLGFAAQDFLGLACVVSVGTIMVM
jgi:hypothetical protein